MPRTRATAGITEPRGKMNMAGTSGPSVTASIRRALVSLVRREDKDCHPQPDVDLCERPAVASEGDTWIIVGSCVGALVVVTLAILIFLHFRRRRRDKQEDMEDRFDRSDYGLDDIPSSRKPRADDDMKSHDGSPQGYGRRSRDPLRAGVEPTYHPGQASGHLNPFDDASSFRSGAGTSKPPSANPAWPKRESSQQTPPS